MAVEPDAHDEHVEHDEQYEEAKRRVEAKKGFYIHAFFFVLLNVIFLAAVGWDFLWATVFWGLGLVLHGASVFFSASDWVRRWEHRAIQRELERQKTGGAPPAPTTGARTGASAAPPPPPKAPTPPRPPQPDDTTPKPTAPRT